MAVMLADNGANRRLLKVHRLVLLAFVGQPPQGKSQVCHKNNIASDNSLSNLRWGSRLDNGADQRIHGSQRGSRNGRAKLTERDVAEIRKRIANGDTCYRIALDLGMRNGTIYKIKNGHLWTSS